MGLRTDPYPNRGPIEISTVTTALSYTPAVRWIQILSAGSGGLVVKDEGNVARTFTGLLAGEVLAGPFTEITSMTLAKIRVGDGPAPPPSTPAAFASLYTSGTSSQGSIDLAPDRFYLLTGAPLALFSNGASAVPGSALVDSKAFAIQWNNNATLNGIVTSFLVPPDMDIAQPATMYVRASKSGATSGDAVTFAVGLYNQVVGALHDADANFGGTTSAMTGNATAKTEQSVSVAILAADLAAFPASVTMTLKPTDGTLGTDDLYFLGARLQYTKKLLSS